MKNRFIGVATAAAIALGGGTLAVAAHADAPPAPPAPPAPGWRQAAAGSNGRVTTIKLLLDGSESYKVSGHVDRFESFQIRSPGILSGDAPSNYTAGDTVDVSTLVDPLNANVAYATTAPGFKAKAQKWTSDPTGTVWETHTNTPARSEGGAGSNERIYELQLCTKSV